MKPIPPPTRVTRVTNAATGVTREFIDYRGSQNLPKRPLVLGCDYCCQDAYRLWCRPTRPFGAVVRQLTGGSVEYYGGSWNACADCKPFVDARDFIGLTHRAATLSGIPPEGCLALFSVVFRCQEDAEVVWSSGDEYPVVDCKDLVLTWAGNAQQ